MYYIDNSAACMEAIHIHNIYKAGRMRKIIGAQVLRIFNVGCPFGSAVRNVLHTVRRARPHEVAVAAKGGTALLALFLVLVPAALVLEGAQANGATEAHFAAG
jgi:hypothetical protein